MLTHPTYFWAPFPPTPENCLQSLPNCFSKETRGMTCFRATTCGRFSVTSLQRNRGLSRGFFRSNSVRNVCLRRGGRDKGMVVDVKASAAADVKQETEIDGMQVLLDGLKWNADGLVAVIVQHVDTGEILMQAFADRAAICETLQTKLATFYSRSRKERWCKGETSGNFITVFGVYPDCDRDSIIYLSTPKGPSCHTGAHTCWFSKVEIDGEGAVQESGSFDSTTNVPVTTLYSLEKTIEERRIAMQSDSGKPSWTAKLLSNSDLLCSKIREEAGELCQTLEQDEGKERATEEMADVLYHSMVLLNRQGVKMEDVMQVLRRRFGVSGIDEKASRSK